MINFNVKHEDLRYWSNSLGELHHPDGYVIIEDQLPDELRMAWLNIWSRSTAYLRSKRYLPSSSCCLVEYQGKYKVSMENNVNAYFAEDKGMKLDDVLKNLKTKAEMYSQLEAFRDCDILIRTPSGIPETWSWYDFIVLLPCNITRERFNQINKILCETVYNMDNIEVTKYLSSYKKDSNGKEQGSHLPSLDPAKVQNMLSRDVFGKIPDRSVRDYLESMFAYPGNRLDWDYVYEKAVEAFPSLLMFPGYRRENMTKDATNELIRHYEENLEKVKFMHDPNSYEEGSLDYDKCMDYIRFAEKELEQVKNGRPW